MNTYHFKKLVPSFCLITTLILASTSAMADKISSLELKLFNNTTQNLTVVWEYITMPGNYGGPVSIEAGQTKIFNFDHNGGIRLNTYNENKTIFQGRAYFYSELSSAYKVEYQFGSIQGEISCTPMCFNRTYELNPKLTISINKVS